MAMITQVNGKPLNTIEGTYVTGQKPVPAGLSTADGVISGVAGDVSAAAGTTGGMNPTSGAAVAGNTPVGLGDMNNLTTV